MYLLKVCIAVIVFTKNWISGNSTEKGEKQKDVVLKKKLQSNTEDKTHT